MLLPALLEGCGAPPHLAAWQRNGVRWLPDEVDLLASVQERHVNQPRGRVKRPRGERHVRHRGRRVGHDSVAIGHIIWWARGRRIAATELDGGGVRGQQCQERREGGRDTATGFWWTRTRSHKNVDGYSFYKPCAS